MRGDNKHSFRWNTEEELKWIANLHTFASPHCQQQHGKDTKKFLLENYIKAAKARVEWGNICGERAIAFAETELALCQ